jgi:hypothetical protein
VAILLLTLTVWNPKQAHHPHLLLSFMQIRQEMLAEKHAPVPYDIGEDNK